MTSLEQARQVPLIGKTAGEGNVDDWRFSLGQQAGGASYSKTHEILVGRQTRDRTEHAREVTRT